MAKRICFVSTPYEKNIYNELEIEFEWFGGFASKQKLRCISSMYDRIKATNNELKVLEISTKSNNELGVSLSAFNLKFIEETTSSEFSVENVFQSSKVFEEGGPYIDLLYVSPKEAKTDIRLKNSGNLKCFKYKDEEWALKPATMFYDWIYINALYRNESLSRGILEYNAFTDIEFNHKKSLNCQARSAAIYVSLVKLGILKKTLKNKKEFSKIYPQWEEELIQISIDDI